MFPPETEEPRRTRQVAGVFPPETEEPRRVKETVASVVPIVESPIPSWASLRDQCADVRSCDSCQSSSSSYCHYSALGQAKCCQAPAPAKRSLVERLAESVAAVTPITENPIPSWASDSDVCSKKRSCDACTGEQYCKYTFSGKPQCCEAASEDKVEQPSLLQLLKESMYSRK